MKALGLEVGIDLRATSRVYERAIRDLSRRAKIRHTGDVTPDSAK